MSEFDFDFSNMADEVENAEELPLFEEDREVRVKILDAPLGQGQYGPYMRVLYEILDEDDLYDIFSDFVNIPHDGLEKRKRHNTNIAFRKFCNCFGVDVRDAFAAGGKMGELFKNHEGYVKVKVKLSEKYGRQNVIAAFVID